MIFSRCRHINDLYHWSANCFYWNWTDFCRFEESQSACRCQYSLTLDLIKCAISSCGVEKASKLRLHYCARAKNYTHTYKLFPKVYGSEPQTKILRSPFFVQLVKGTFLKLVGLNLQNGSR